MQPKLIVLWVVDSLRADHTSAAGYARATTPALDELASEGVWWEHAHATAPWTKPSIASLLTGLYPTQHGAFEGVKRSRGDAPDRTDAIRTDRPTLAERLTASGWRCGAFINNAQLGPFTGLDRGFERYDAEAGKADRLLEAAGRWLAAERSRPTFLYLHFLEAHWPYKPRRRHVAMFGGDRDTNAFRDYSARDYARLRREMSRGLSVLREDLLEQMIQMYDGAIRRLDGKLAEFRTRLDELGLRDHTALFFTADHGEELLDHGRIGHGQALWQELLRVPLAACWPGGPRGRRIAEPVSLVDLAEAIRRTAKGAPPAAVLESFQRPVLAELRIRKRQERALRHGDWMLHVRVPPEEPGREPRAASADASPAAARPELELYDLSRDPREQVDLAHDARHTANLAGLGRRFEEIWSTIAADAAPARAGPALSTELVQRLRSLGYLD